MRVVCDEIKAELRGYAPIGIMEYWNDGIMGSGKMWQWFIGKIFLEIEPKKCENSF